ncbi:unnamed protein product [Vitrella brassicaformis CCMP3155]|uniref:Cyclic nucleotide-binding domain-containing protein n=4 Tax=Vitrella brassicaformis TaxID=1169539 RepID=A0A0G4EHP1_VITBC|nr:unnamed protein product [Vitrella brassicaformis CCMP3155]|eukprot:CEL95419.1 unnamed protein product [Vitrella brassicaformis CCMP3155]
MHANWKNHTAAAIESGAMSSRVRASVLLQSAAAGDATPAASAPPAVQTPKGEGQLDQADVDRALRILSAVPPRRRMPKDIEVLRKVLVTARVFADLEDSALNRLCDESECFYLILRGTVGVFRRNQRGREQHLTDLHVGQAFGEWGLIRKEKRSATVRSQTVCEFLVLDKYNYETILLAARNDQVKRQAARDVVKATQPNRRTEEDMKILLEYLENLPQLVGVPLESLRAVASGWPHETLCEETDPPLGVYILLRGTVGVYRRKTRGEMVSFEAEESEGLQPPDPRPLDNIAAVDLVIELKADSFLGEWGAARNAPRLASLVALTAIDIAEIPRNIYYNLLRTVRWPTLRWDITSEILSRRGPQKRKHEEIEALVDTLGDKSILQPIDVDAKKHLLRRVTWRRVEKGDAFYKQGDDSDAVYIIITGSVAIFTADHTRHDEPPPSNQDEQGEGEGQEQPPQRPPSRRRMSRRRDTVAFYNRETTGFHPHRPSKEYEVSVTQFAGAGDRQGERTGDVQQDSGDDDGGGADERDDDEKVLDMRPTSGSVFMYSSEKKVLREKAADGAIFLWGEGRHLAVTPAPSQPLSRVLSRKNTTLSRAPSGTLTDTPRRPSRKGTFQHKPSQASSSDARGSIDTDGGGEKGTGDMPRETLTETRFDVFVKGCGQGDVFGEKGVFLHEARGGTAVALDETEVVLIPKKVYNSCMRVGRLKHINREKNMLTLQSPPEERTVAETQALCDLLKGVKALDMFDAAFKLELAKCLTLQMAEEGETLFCQGERADSLMIVLKGCVGVYLLKSPPGGEMLVGQKREGDVLGELALLTEQPRSATCRAISKTTMARLGKEEFRSLADKYKQVPWREQVILEILRLKQPDTRSSVDLALISGLLRTYEFAKGLPNSALIELAREVRWEYAPEGKTLFHQGDVGNEFYLLLKGMVGIYSRKISSGSMLRTLVSMPSLHHEDDSPVRPRHPHRYESPLSSPSGSPTGSPLSTRRRKRSSREGKRSPKAAEKEDEPQGGWARFKKAWRKVTLVSKFIEGAKEGKKAAKAGPLGFSDSKAAAAAAAGQKGGPVSQQPRGSVASTQGRRSLAMRGVSPGVKKMKSMTSFNLSSPPNSTKRDVEKTEMKESFFEKLRALRADEEEREAAEALQQYEGPDEHDSDREDEGDTRKRDSRMGRTVTWQSRLSESAAAPLPLPISHRPSQAISDVTSVLPSSPSDTSPISPPPKKPGHLMPMMPLRMPLSQRLMVLAAREVGTSTYRSSPAAKQQRQHQHQHQQQVQLSQAGVLAADDESPRDGWGESHPDAMTARSLTRALGLVQDVSLSTVEPPRLLPKDLEKKAWAGPHEPELKGPFPSWLPALLGLREREGGRSSTDETALSLHRLLAARDTALKKTEEVPFRPSTAPAHRASDLSAVSSIVESGGDRRRQSLSAARARRMNVQKEGATWVDVHETLSGLDTSALVQRSSEEARKAFESRHRAAEETGDEPSGKCSLTVSIPTAIKRPMTVPPRLPGVTRKSDHHTFITQTEGERDHLQQPEESMSMEPASPLTSQSTPATSSSPRASREISQMRSKEETEQEMLHVLGHRFCPAGYYLLGIRREGESFGERALLVMQERSATVRTLMPSEFLVLDKQPFDRIIKAELHKEKRDKNKFLKVYIPGLDRQSFTTRERLSYLFKDESKTAGATIVREGELLACLFIVREGFCTARRRVEVGARGGPGPGRGGTVLVMPRRDPQKKQACTRKELLAATRGLFFHKDYLDVSSCVRGHIIGLSSVFLGLPEPFTVIARSAKVDLYAISASDLRAKLPTSCLDRLAELASQEMPDEIELRCNKIIHKGELATQHRILTSFGECTLPSLLNSPFIHFKLHANPLALHLLLLKQFEWRKPHLSKATPLLGFSFHSLRDLSLLEKVCLEFGSWVPPEYSSLKDEVQRAAFFMGALLAPFPPSAPAAALGDWRVERERADLDGMAGVARPRDAMRRDEEERMAVWANRRINEAMRQLGGSTEDNNPYLQLPLALPPPLGPPLAPPAAAAAIEDVHPAVPLLAISAPAEDPEVPSDRRGEEETHEGLSPSSIPPRRRSTVSSPPPSHRMMIETSTKDFDETPRDPSKKATLTEQSYFQLPAEITAPSFELEPPDDEKTPKGLLKIRLEEKSHIFRVSKDKLEELWRPKKPSVRVEGRGERRPGTAIPVDRQSALEGLKEVLQVPLASSRSLAHRCVVVPSKVMRDTEPLVRVPQATPQERPRSASVRMTMTPRASPEPAVATAAEATPPAPSLTERFQAAASPQPTVPDFPVMLLAEIPRMPSDAGSSVPSSSRPEAPPPPFNPPPFYISMDESQLYRAGSIQHMLRPAPRPSIRKFPSQLDSTAEDESRPPREPSPPPSPPETSRPVTANVPTRLPLRERRRGSAVTPRRPSDVHRAGGGGRYVFSRALTYASETRRSADSSTPVSALQPAVHRMGLTPRSASGRNSALSGMSHRFTPAPASAREAVTHPRGSPDSGAEVPTDTKEDAVRDVMIHLPTRPSTSTHPTRQRRLKRASTDQAPNAAAGRRRGRGTVQRSSHDESGGKGGDQPAAFVGVSPRAMPVS